MTDEQWKSEVLRYHTTVVGYQLCKICRFLKGDRSESVLMEVIRILDIELAAAMEAEKRLIAARVNKSK